MQLKFTKSTDTEHKVKLESSLVSVSWRCGRALAGQTAALEVHTSFVGDGAPIEIKLMSEADGHVSKVKGKVCRNKFLGTVQIPADASLGDKVYFKADLSKHGLSGESEHIPVLPAARVSNLGWSVEEARRGDVLTLTADVQGLPDQTEVALVIYEYDADGVHDRIIELPGTVVSEKVEVRWEYEYQEDTDEIPTQEERERYGSSYNPPEYFFTVKVDDTEFGLEQDSGLLTFKDWVEIELIDNDGTPMGGQKYKVMLADGSVKEGTLDDDGTARLQGIPPGRCEVEFPDVEGYNRQRGA